MNEVEEVTLKLIAQRVSLIFPRAWELLCDLTHRPITVATDAEITGDELREMNMDVLLAHTWLSKAVAVERQCLFFLTGTFKLFAFPKDQHGTDQLMDVLRSPTHRESQYFYTRLAQNFPEAMAELHEYAAATWRNGTPRIVSSSSLPAETWEQIVDIHAQSTLRNSVCIKLRVHTRLLYPGTLIVQRITGSLDACTEASLARQATLITG